MYQDYLLAAQLPLLWHLWYSYKQEIFYIARVELDIWRTFFRFIGNKLGMFIWIFIIMQLHNCVFVYLHACQVEQPQILIYHKKQIKC